MTLTDLSGLYMRGPEQFAAYLSRLSVNQLMAVLGTVQTQVR
jgi:hypothetical protein